MKQKVDKYQLVIIRKELHEDIYNEVNGMEHKALTVLREPNKTKKQPAPKMIVVVHDEKQAETINENCRNLITRVNESIKRELKESAFPHYEIKYSINIVHSESDILLSVGDAQRRKRMNGAKIKSKLQKLQCQLDTRQKIEHNLLNTEVDKYKSTIEHIEQYINILDDDTDYIFAESTGCSYRVTYFDGNCRQQISAGNLLIVVSPFDIKILDAPSRKRRSDKKEYIYRIDIGDLGTIFIYPV